jgi:SAM-dependent methyltransferase
VTDYDDAMVAAATRLLARRQERVTVRQADATALPFGDDSFDAVLSVLMLHHVVNWEQALAEAARGPPPRRRRRRRQPARHPSGTPDASAGGCELDGTPPGAAHNP